MSSIRLWIVLLVVSVLHADAPLTPVKTLDDSVLKLAEEAVKKDFDAIYLQRRRVTACVATAALAVGAVCAYRWARGSAAGDIKIDAKALEKINEIIHDSGKTSSGNKLDTQAQPAVQEHESIGKRVLSWAKANFSWQKAHDHLPADPKAGGMIKRSLLWAGEGLFGLSKLLVLPLAFNGVAQFAMERAMRFYRTLDWAWLLSSRTHLLTYFDQLKAAAAVLDTRSTLFETCSHITINADQSVATRGDTQVWPMASLDEILRLKTIAQRGGVEGFDPTLYENQLIRLWNAYIDALAYAVAFVRYGMAHHAEVSYFDKNQAQTFIDDVIVHTRAVAAQLPALIDACVVKRSQSTSAGLLACMHEYTYTIQRSCSDLEFNEIVQGG